MDLSAAKLECCACAYNLLSGLPFCYLFIKILLVCQPYLYNQYMMYSALYKLLSLPLVLVCTAQLPAKLLKPEILSVCLYGLSAGAIGMS